jgi:hypothetical protein
VWLGRGLVVAWAVVYATLVVVSVKLTVDVWSSDHYGQ